MTANAEPVTHMTVYALGVILGMPPHYIWYNAHGQNACDWEQSENKQFTSIQAQHFMKGAAVERPPTCPQCCVMMDLGLELRGSTSASTKPFGENK